MTTERVDFRTPLGLSLLLSVLFLTACGSNIIRGEPPIVRMSELSHQGNTIKLQLSMRNLNGVDLDITSTDFSLTVNDSEQELLAYNGPLNTNIGAKGTEVWSVEVAESKTSRELLDSMENGDIKSLPYKLKGSVYSKDDGKLRFEYEGHIYPLPGKPGHFR